MIMPRQFFAKTVPLGMVLCLFSLSSFTAFAQAGEVALSVNEVVPMATQTNAAFDRRRVTSVLGLTAHAVSMNGLYTGEISLPILFEKARDKGTLLTRTDPLRVSFGGQWIPTTDATEPNVHEVFDLDHIGISIGVVSPSPFSSDVDNTVLDVWRYQLGLDTGFSVYDLDAEFRATYEGPWVGKKQFAVDSDTMTFKPGEVFFTELRITTPLLRPYFPTLSAGVTVFRKGRIETVMVSYDVTHDPLPYVGAALAYEIFRSEGGTTLFAEAGAEAVFGTYQVDSATYLSGARSPEHRQTALHLSALVRFE